MATSKSPFAIADRYIELRKQYVSPSWGNTMMRFNELILTPILTLCMVMLEKTDFLSLVSSVLNIWRSWKEWIEFNNLRFEIQQMYLLTMRTGGPHIVTNDPTYLPYVYADAVVRHASHRPGSAKAHRQEGPWKHTQ